MKTRDSIEWLKCSTSQRTKNRLFSHQYHFHEGMNGAGDIDTINMKCLEHENNRSRNHQLGLLRRRLTLCWTDSNNLLFGMVHTPRCMPSHNCGICIGKMRIRNCNYNAQCSTDVLGQRFCQSFLVPTDYFEASITGLMGPFHSCRASKSWSESKLWDNEIGLLNQWVAGALALQMFSHEQFSTRNTDSEHAFSWPKSAAMALMPTVVISECDLPFEVKVLAHSFKVPLPFKGFWNTAFLSMPWMREVESHPVRAWRKSRWVHMSCPRKLSILPILYTLRTHLDRLSERRKRSLISNSVCGKCRRRISRSVYSPIRAVNIF